MYEQTQGAAGNGAGPDMSGAAGAGSTTGAPEDDVVDADFKEV